MASLGTHRGSAEVICAAYCTGRPPRVWWHTADDAAAAREIERTLKREYGEPPIPRDEFAACVNGERLRSDLVAAAGPSSWQAGYAEAVFAIGEKLKLLFQPQFDEVWRRVGVPPGPWRA